MKKFIMIWMTNTISLWVVSSLMKSIYFTDVWAMLLTALFLSILNATLKPVLKVLSLPISILTLGLFSLVINGVTLYIAISLADGSYITSFGMAIVASILLSVVNGVIEMITE